MARVTVEDCVEKEPNRFDLVMIAAQRARDISAGSALTVDRDNDKNPVVALREIADSTVTLDDLREGLVKIHQKHVESDEAEEEIIELMAGEEDWLAKGVTPEGTAEVPETEDLGGASEGASGAAADESDGSGEGEDTDLGEGIDPGKMDELAREVEAALDIDAGEGADDEET